MARPDALVFRPEAEVRRGLLRPCRDAVDSRPDVVNLWGAGRDAARRGVPDMAGVIPEDHPGLTAVAVEISVVRVLVPEAAVQGHPAWAWFPAHPAWDGLAARWTLLVLAAEELYTPGEARSAA